MKLVAGNPTCSIHSCLMQFQTVKRSSTCQCIIKASRPRTALPPLLFALGIECGHVFGSKWLVNELLKLGFCISYSEVNRFKKSVVANQPTGNSVINSYPKLSHSLRGSMLIIILELLMDQGHFMEWGLQRYQLPFQEILF